ncbi:MAG: MgtC/SapB family protein [Alphaproteobacteria bacterium]
MFFVEMPAWDVTLRILVAAVLGMAVGFEREFRRKPAGIRTHMLVATGASAFIIITLEMIAGPLQEIEGVKADPTRIIQGVIGGIGFLGAGAIIQGKGEVTGLTTGASIWVAGAIGIATGIGFFDIAVLLMVIVVIIIIVFVIGRIENAVMNRLDNVDGIDRPEEGHDKPE